MVTSGGVARNRKATILLVEDEALVRMNTAEELRTRGFEVLEAADGAAAMALLKASPEIDLVFADLIIPGEPDGLELARWIRSQRPSLPVILTSGTVFQSVPANVAKAVTELLNQPFVAKPYDIAEIVERMRELLGGKPLTRGA